MSLTSLELNYLIWRYLQESGFELAAYALQKDSYCLDYEQNNNKLVKSIDPGCLVNLVQKGILYTLVEDGAQGKEDRLTLIDAIVKDKALFDASLQSRQIAAHSANNEGSEPKTEDNKTSDDVTMKDADGEPASNGSNEKEASDEPEIEFHTEKLASHLSYAPGLASDWHPATDVLAIGHEDSTAAVYAFGSEGIAETVTLNHPPVLVNDKPVKNAITLVSWSPQGTSVLTSGYNGEIRAWTPDGRLKNIVNSLTDSEKVPAMISSLIWNPRGSLVLSIDVNNTLSVWDGSTLANLSEFKGELGSDYEVNACWLSDSKFAMSTGKNSIKIYSVNPSLPYGESVVPVGQLSGHAHAITNMCFSPISKLLASASDVDYVIKVWNSSSSHEALEINIASENEPFVHYHTSPIIELQWLCRPGDVQGNELLSVSMEGTVNIWDAFTGDAIVSANIFKNGDNFNFGEEDSVNIMTDKSLVFASAVSPNCELLAIGDDSGNVSVWDIKQSRYTGTKELLRCLAIYAVEETGEFGICDLAWDSKGRYISVCYKGKDSVMLKWDRS